MDAGSLKGSSSKQKILGYSVVVPIYNEEGSIFQLDKEIKHVMNKISQNYEVIYIDDASKDNSLNELKKLLNVKIIALNRNYGQSTALDAGFKAAKGEIVISIDGDGQNDPADIPRLLQKLKEDNLDVVAGWRKNRADKAGIKALTKTGRLLRKLLIKDSVHDTGCTLRVYRKEAIKSLDLQGEMHRYILAILRWKGFKIGEVIVNDRKREYGKSKYGYDKAVRGLIDLVYVWFISKYSQRPLHIFGLAGILSFFAGILIEIWMGLGKMFWNYDLSANAWFILGFFFMIGGLMAFSFGIVIDLLIKIQLNSSPYERRYYVREIIEN